MKRLCVFLACLVFVGINTLQAQRTVQITGTVTGAEDGMPIPGASVQVKGTTVGASTDADGKYSLNVPEDATTLIFSFVGLRTQEVEIGGRTVIDVVLEFDALALEEIVVTALGISREKKALGYSVQEVSGDDIKQVGQTNVLNSLTGKIAGVQITGASGNTGGSAKILIRGVSSISKDNGPLFVIDGVPIDNSSYNTSTANAGAGGFDYGNMAQDINPDDVESITVLKGAAASALYGSRAMNGVILITTKKGTDQRGLGVTFNSGVTFEQVAYNPAHQKLYGGGTTFSGAGTDAGFQLVTINGTEYRVPDFAVDESWGPKYDPSIGVLAWNSFDEWDSENYLKAKPWVYPENDYLAMFDLGVTYTNSVAVAGADEEGNSFRLSYTNMTVDGYTPNNKMQRNTVNFNGNGKFSKYLEAFTTFNYTRTWAQGRPETGYGDHNPVMRMNQWGQNQLDYEELKDYLNPDGSQRTWNRTSWSNPTPVYSDNPYWTYYQNYPEDSRNRFFGNVGFNLNLLDWVKFRGTVKMDHYDFNAETRVAIGSQAESGYTLQQRINTEMNYEGMFLIDKNITDDITLNAMFGANRRDERYVRTGGETVGGLLLPGWYNLQNSSSNALAYNFWTKKRVNSLFGSLTIGFMNMAYLDATMRNDWSSSLPEGSNSYKYPSITGSFIFSELAPLKDNEILSFGKVRLNWAKVGADAPAYYTSLAFAAEQNFGADPNFRLPNTLNNPNLKPEESTSYEAGIELNFLNNRVGLDFTYYNTDTRNQVITVARPPAFGYAFEVINAGLINNNGIEFLLTGTPLKGWNGLTWDVSLNFSKNNNTLEELADDNDPNETIRLASLFGMEIHAQEGEKFGTIRGYNYVLDDNGNRIIGTNGRYLNGPVETLGSYLPDWNAGLVNTFSYKGIDLMVQIDMQKGGQMFSLTHLWSMYSGINEKSAMTNENGNNIRDAVEDGGGVLLEGVYGELDENGDIVYTDADGNVVTTPVANETWIGGDRWCWDHYSRARGGQNVFDTDYIKLREVRIGYTIPAKFTGPINNVKISAFGRNLAIWNRAEGVDWDPEYLHGSGNVQGIEGAALPSVRTFGFNLSLNF